MSLAEYEGRSKHERWALQEALTQRIIEDNWRNRAREEDEPT